MRLVAVRSGALPSRWPRSCARRLEPIRARIPRRGQPPACACGGWAFRRVWVRSLRRSALPIDARAPLARERAGLLEVHLIFLGPLLDVDRVITTARHRKVREPFSLFGCVGRVERRQIFGSRRRDGKPARARGDQPEEEQQLHVLRAVAGPEYVGGKAESIRDASEYRDLLGCQGCGQTSLLESGSPAWPPKGPASVRHRTSTCLASTRIGQVDPQQARIQFSNRRAASRPLDARAVQHRSMLKHTPNTGVEQTFTSRRVDCLTACIEGKDCAACRAGNLPWCLLHCCLFDRGVSQPSARAGFKAHFNGPASACEEGALDKQMLSAYRTRLRDLLFATLVGSLAVVLRAVAQPLFGDALPFVFAFPATGELFVAA